MTPSPALRLLRAGAVVREALVPWVRAGINGVLLPVPWRTAGDPAVPLDADIAADENTPVVEMVRSQAQQLRGLGVRCFFDIALDRVARDAAPTTCRVEWLQTEGDLPELDPRLPVEALQTRTVRGDTDAFVDSWVQRLTAWVDAGVDGFYLQRPQGLPAKTLRELFTRLRQQAPEVAFIAATQGMRPEEIRQRASVGFDWSVNSLPWWDGRADWLADEDWRLREMAPVLAPVAVDADARAAWLAAFCGDGLLIEGDPASGPSESVAQAVEWHTRARHHGPLTVVGGQAGRATVLLRRSAQDETVALAISPAGKSSCKIDIPPLAGLLTPGPLSHLDGPEALRPRAGSLGDSQCALLIWRGPMEVKPGERLPRDERSPQAPRLAIENVEPTLEVEGLPVKCIAHEPLTVRATIIMDGHDKLAADLCWRPCDGNSWQRVPMRWLGNDRWEAAFVPERIGAHEYRVQAWQDIWAGYCHEWHSKHDAGQSIITPLHEGLAWLERTVAQAERLGAKAEHLGRLKRAVKAVRQVLDGKADVGEVLKQLCEPSLLQIIRDTAERPHARSSNIYALRVDRNRARYANWYELFPRSQAQDRHGRFDDVVERLPDIRAMGFDVLYLTPIHPIGERNRKGRNNSLKAEPGDVGSPYAIGSAHGGHDAVAPELGTLEDFERLVHAAQAHGMEVALDFAIQCSPDHPWLKRHPNWFSWQADGSLRYAENPPKRYEDIVNVAFYEGPPQWRRKTALWRALRDIVLFWAERGVRIFRVDNPHTKPLPFWQWLIAEVHLQYPDTVFLAEAFTRPAMMYRLAKVGFTQSYTYFTWRNHRQELVDYFTELSSEPVASFYRPHFFVNTPDINPYYLQSHGRPGFLARAALAATGSGLWGIYSGFELCESAALTGREEYLDSEKYELRPRDWHQPGNIRSEITKLNAIRRANPALQSHRGFAPLTAWPESVIAYIKRAPGGANVVLIVINLDPQQALEAVVRMPSSHGEAEDLLTGTPTGWGDGMARFRLTPEAPYAIWRLPADPIGA
ncbi:alpha-1,4-glucan--maltose-1-phosphate maltosyltransferase [Bordetella sp. 15P40C-2]|uniref:alpha-1,4-glucan--maltose-1-phosphate maltosyltransferase n=1 Tax=Bordetella sp. 15P40C-2 TaxID=2572246 RepID=UPI00136533D9